MKGKMKQKMMYGRLGVTFSEWIKEKRREISIYRSDSANQIMKQRRWKEKEVDKEKGKDVIQRTVRRKSRKE